MRDSGRNFRVVEWPIARLLRGNPRAKVFARRERITSNGAPLVACVRVCVCVRAYAYVKLAWVAHGLSVTQLKSILFLDLISNRKHL